MRKKPKNALPSPDPNEELESEPEEEEEKESSEKFISLTASRSSPQERVEEGGEGTINPPFP
jgi:hypothetical protein